MIYKQEARSKYTVDIEPEDAATIDPLEGDLSSEGTAMLHYNRSSPSASMGKINCKVSFLVVLYSCFSFYFLGISEKNNLCLSV